MGEFQATGYGIDPEDGSSTDDRAKRDAAQFRAVLAAWEARNVAWEQGRATSPDSRDRVIDVEDVLDVKLSDGAREFLADKLYEREYNGTSESACVSFAVGWVREYKDALDS